jgi:hypothetical protein
MDTAQLTPLRLNTPLEDHLADLGLLVKREDLSCPPPGPPFSKMRGVISHMRKQVEAGVKLFGALDTSHSQAGHAVAYGARLLGVECVNYFPVYKADFREPTSGEGVPSEWAGVTSPGKYLKIRDPQLRSNELGAMCLGITAGRSAVLYHTAKRDCEARGGYMMPNALKLAETVEETAAEVVRTFEGAQRSEFEVLRSSPWLISCSSATIASGVLRGLEQAIEGRRQYILHMGYSRSSDAVCGYVNDRLNREKDRIWPHGLVDYVDEGYAYADQAKAGPDPSWPCNPYYDLKAFRWWMRTGRAIYGRAVLWNIG